MTLTDNCCSLAPYFKVASGKMDEFKAGCETFVTTTDTEEKVMFYGFSFNGDMAHCREGYQDADSLLNHLDNVGELLKQALTISELVRLEVHGPAAEIEKLRGPLAGLNPDFFVLETGFRR